MDKTIPIEVLDGVLKDKLIEALVGEGDEAPQPLESLSVLSVWSVVVQSHAPSNWRKEDWENLFRINSGHLDSIQAALTTRAKMPRGLEKEDLDRLWGEYTEIQDRVCNQHMMMARVKALAALSAA